MRQFPKEAVEAPNKAEKNQIVNDGPVLVETRGYMTLRQQIERALAAGVLHENWRREHFPADFDIPEDYWPQGYLEEEQDILAQYQFVVDGRTRAMARLEQAQKKEAEAKGEDFSGVKQPEDLKPAQPAGEGSIAPT